MTERHANLRPGGRRKIEADQLWYARVPGICQPVRVRVLKWAGTKRDPVWKVGVVVPGCHHAGSCVIGERFTLLERDLLQPAPAVEGA